MLPVCEWSIFSHWIVQSCLKPCDKENIFLCQSFIYKVDRNSVHWWSSLREGYKQRLLIQLSSCHSMGSYKEWN